MFRGLATGFCTVIFCQSVIAATIRVPQDQPNIQAAINAASSGDVVLVSAGDYTGFGNSAINFQNKSISLLAEDGPKFTRIICDGGRVFDFASSSGVQPIIDGFSFTGNGELVLRSLGASPIVRNCVFDHLQMTGMVLYFNGGPSASRSTGSPQGTSARVENCTFVGNTTSLGAIYFQYGGIALTVARCIFDHNEGPTPQVYSDTYGSLAITCCDFFGNSRGDYWGMLAPYATTDGNFSADPSFCSGTGTAYLLSPTSPCLPSNNSCGIIVGALNGCGNPSLTSLAFTPINSHSHVTSLTPEISWVLADSAGLPQTDYKVEVGTDADWSTAEMWDSGPVSSALMSVTYGGLPLEEGVRYWVRVSASNGVQWSDWFVSSFRISLGSNALRVPLDYSTIQAALDAAAFADDTIIVAPGTYTGSGNVQLNFRGKSPVLMSAEGASQTFIVVSGQRAFDFASATPTTPVIQGFTFQGSADVIIRSLGSSLSIRKCIFDHTSASIVIYLNGNPSIGVAAAEPESPPSPSVEGCTFVGNSASLHTIYAQHAGIFVRVDSCLFYQNVGSSPQIAVEGTLGVHCTDLFGNSGGDWVGGLSGLGAINGNFSADPEFCEISGLPYFLSGPSPCLSGANSCGSQVGANGACELPAITSFNIEPLSPFGPVASVTPTFIWSALYDPGGVQQEYELQIGVDNDWTVAEVWNSGTVISSDTSWAYTGSGIFNESNYWCRIRVYDGAEWSTWRTRSFHVSISAHIIEVPTGLPTIQAAIDASQWPGDTILVYPGTYAGFNFKGKNITVRSAEGPTNTFVTGGSDETLVTFSQNESALAILEGFTFKGGGIAIMCNGGMPTIRYNVFTDQKYGGWGAVVLYSAATFVNNTMAYGANGAIAVYVSNATIKNNIISNYPHYGIHGAYNSNQMTYNDVFGNNPNYENSVAPGIGSISVNPLFVSGPGRDFRLQAGSPCIDAGDPAPEYFDGDYTRNDMGALSVFGYGVIPPVPRPFVIVDADTNNRITNFSPTIAWRYDDNATSTQVMYHIQVSSTGNFIAPDMWDTGPVASSDTAVLYGGSPLANHKRYIVRVRLNNGQRWGSWMPRSFVTFLPGPIRVPAEQSSIQSALGLTIDGDTVLVAPGTYNENLIFTGSRVVLKSEQGREATIITPYTVTSPILTFRNHEDSGAVLEGFAISGASASGIYCTNSSPTIRNCEIRNCVSAGDGAGIYCDDWSSPHLIGNLIHGNQAGSNRYGGGVFTKGLRDLEVVIEGNEIFNNWGTFGSGIALTGNHFRVSRNIIYDNLGSSTTTSAGIYVGDVFGTNGIVNNTVVRNSAGILLTTGNSNFIKNTIVAFNIGVGLSATANNADYNDEFGNGTNVLGSLQGISEDPLFVDASNNNFELLEISPCRDAGDPFTAYNDQDGTRNDIGALPYHNAAGSPFVSNISLGAENPGHVNSTTPTFSWTVQFASGSFVVESEIQVGSDADWSVTEMWSPPGIPGPTLEAVYGGSTLQYGTTYYVRVRVLDGIGWSPWRVRQFTINTPPGQPTLVGPNKMTFATLPTLYLQNTTDGDGDPLVYTFEMYGDSMLTLFEWTATNVPAGQGITSTPVNFNPRENKIYYWRAAAWDGYRYGDWSATMAFGWDSIPTAPLVVPLLSPVTGPGHLPVFELLPEFRWAQPSDVDPFERFRYELQLSLGPSFTTVFSTDSIQQLSYTILDSLKNGTQYWWRVIATDKYGLRSPTYLSKFFTTWELGDMDNSGRTDIGDLVVLIDHLYISFTPLPSNVAGDVDGDCRVDISDVTTLIDRLYLTFAPLKIGCE